MTSWSTSRALNEKNMYIYIFFTLGWNAFICLLRPSKTTTIKMWACPHDVSAFFSLSPSLSLTVFSLPRYFDVCVYITWRIKLHVSDDLSPYNNPQRVPVDINPWKNTAEVNFGDSPVAFGRINTESGIWRWMDFYFLVHSSGFLISSVSQPHHALWNILHVPFFWILLWHLWLRKVSAHLLRSDLNVSLFFFFFYSIGKITKWERRAETELCLLYSVTINACIDLNQFLPVLWSYVHTGSRLAK